MKRKIIGVEPVNYTSKKTGEEVSGITLYLGSKSTTVFGMTTMDHFVSSKSPSIKQFLPYEKDCGQLLDMDVELDFNNRGFVENLELVI